MLEIPNHRLLSQAVQIQVSRLAFVFERDLLGADA